MSAIFDRLLGSLDLKISAIGYCEVHSGWRLSFPPSPIAHVHYVLQGTGRLEIPGRQPILLGPETFVLIPSALKGQFEASGRTIREVEAALEAQNGPSLLQHIKAGDGTEMPLVFVCGTVMLDSAGRRCCSTRSGKPSPAPNWNPQ
ncbi:hypothetical protein ABIB57_004269 [Devosia sp. UYZn731]|uniref:cupin domain-containing protein n=1 Tax=Devosia sp. UYZn731 TaxID=3156345 RepID=UPI00339B2D13